MCVPSLLSIEEMLGMVFIIDVESGGQGDDEGN